MDEEDFNILKQCSIGNLTGLDKASIDYLKQEYIIVDDDEELYNRIKIQRNLSRYNNKILVLTIAPTLGCNFKCSYCYESGRIPKNMDSSVVEGIYKFIANFVGLQALRITWYGGEPLLKYNLIKQMSLRLIKEFPDYQAAMITNGYLLSENVCRNLSKLKITQLQITLDGLQHTHNQRRPHKYNQDSFQRIISNLELLFNICPNIGVVIRVNTDKSNQHEYQSLYQFLSNRFKGKRIHIQPGYVTDTFSEERNPSCMKSCDKVAFILHQQKNNIPIPTYPRSEYGECSARHINSFVVGPQGELYKCWNDIGNLENSIGSVFDFKMSHPLTVRYLMKADPLSSQECKECFFFPVCNGGCPYTRINSLSENNADTCELYKENIEDFLYASYLSKNKENKKNAYSSVKSNFVD